MTRQVRWLSAATFIIGTETFLIVGTLSSISDDLNVSLSTAGSLVTIYAVIYAVGAPFLAALTGALDRKLVLVFAMLGFALANFIAAAAGGFWLLFAARGLAAATASLFTPAAFALAGAVSEQSARGRALAMVNGGFSVAIAFGVPASIWIAVHSNWRVAFSVVGILSLIVTAGLVFRIEPTPAQAKVELRARVAPVRNFQVVLALIQSVVWTMGTFTSATFFAPLLQLIANADGDMIGFAFLISGICGVIGTFAGGALVDRLGAERLLFPILIVHGVALACFSVLAQFAGPHVALIPVLAATAITGFASWAISSIQLARLLDLASDAGSLVLSLNRSAVNLGVALGSLLGAAIIQISGLAYLGWGSAGCELIAVLLLAVSHRRREGSTPWKKASSS
jgi:predicted MFS family arabinose efflux permease